MRPATDHPRAARFLLVLGVVLAVLALLLTGLRFAVLNENRFVAASSSALATDEVSSVVGEQLTTQLIGAAPDLVAFAPLLDTAVTSVVRSGAAQSAVEVAARQLYRTAVDGDADTAVLRLGTVGLLAVQSARSLSPEISARIPKSVDSALVSLEAGDAAQVIGRVTETAHVIRVVSWVLTGLALLALLAAALVRRPSSLGIRHAGVAVAAAGALTIVVYHLIRTVAVDRLTGDRTRDTGFAIFDAFLGDTVNLALATVATGLLVVVAVGALSRRSSLTSTVRARWTSLRSTRQGTQLIGAAAALLGIVVLLDRETAWQFIVPALGLALLIGGLEALLRSVAPEDEEATEGTAVADATAAAGAGSPSSGPSDATPRRRSRRLAVRVAVVVAVVLIGTAVIGKSVDDSFSIAALASPTKQCNGSAALCDLRVDQVAIPSTHNSYSAARDGFLLANQQSGVAKQLQGGVRGLLIDTYLAQGTRRGVYTRLDLSPNSAEKVESTIGPDATRTALRLREQLNGEVSKDAPVDVYLCHGFCELGAVKAIDVLRDVRDFLLAHPGEVIVFSVEDQVPPDRFAQLVKDAGLYDLTWKGSVAPLPTLGEMVDAGQRALFLVEEDAGTVPWLHQQFEVAQETPYNLTSRKALLSAAGCAPNRGTAALPMMLLNHFIESIPPRVSIAQQINPKATIVEHAERCRKIRDRMSNLVAVDFWETGDVVGATDELNEQAIREHAED